MSGRRLGAALVTGVALALVFDVLLGIALGAARTVPAASNWQMAIVTKGAWLLAVSAATLIAPSLLWIARQPIAWSEAFETAGIVLIATPLIWTGVTIFLFAIRISLTGGWDTEGQILLQSGFYGELITTGGPWLLAGAALRVTSQHLR